MISSWASYRNTVYLGMINYAQYVMVGSSVYGCSTNVYATHGWIWAPKGAAMSVPSLQLKSTKRLAYDIIYTSSTNAGLVHDMTQTAKTRNGSFCNFQLSGFNKQGNLSTEKKCRESFLFHSYWQSPWCFFDWRCLTEQHSARRY